MISFFQTNGRVADTEQRNYTVLFFLYVENHSLIVIAISTGYRTKTTKYVFNINKNKMDDNTEGSDNEERKMPALLRNENNFLNIDTDGSDNDSANGDISGNNDEEERKSFVIYEPTFRSELILKAKDGELDFKEAHELLQNEDWLTDGLCREIVNHRP